MAQTAEEAIIKKERDNVWLHFEVLPEKRCSRVNRSTHSFEVQLAKEHRLRGKQKTVSRALYSKRTISDVSLRGPDW